jgi:hypothetical protein
MKNPRDPGDPGDPGDHPGPAPLQPSGPQRPAPPTAAADPLVQPIAAVLYRDEEALTACLARLGEATSPLDFRGAPHPFDQTDYYAPEMGAGLSRVLVSFRALRPPTFLVAAKHAAGALEDALRVEGKRRVNVDVGYLDLGKLVLASWKARGHKLYLGEGVWGDLTLLYGEGRWQPLEWSFPDFRTGRYDADLHAIRERYKRRLREAQAQPGPPP